MPITINKLEELGIAKVGERCCVISLSDTDKERSFASIGDVLEVDNFTPSNEEATHYIWFKNLTTRAKQSDFIFEDTVIERIKD